MPFLPYYRAFGQMLCYICSAVFQWIFLAFHIYDRSPFNGQLNINQFVTTIGVLPFDVEPLFSNWSRRQPVDIQLRHFVPFPGCVEIYVPMDTWVQYNALRIFTSWLSFLHHWPFCGGIQRSLVDYSHKGPVIRSFSMFTLAGLD